MGIGLAVNHLPMGSSCVLSSQKPLSGATHPLHPNFEQCFNTNQNGESMTIQLRKIGNSTGLILPAFAVKALDCKAGSRVHLLVLEREVRLKPVMAKQADDNETYEDFQERELKASLKKW
jgi:antitoxin component of MazEF toxin-antitoxin module